MRILIIEDNADIVANLYAFLEPRGYVLDSATNGYAGFALAAQHEYDAMILDVKLPGIDGLSVCRRIRDELKKDTPVLMLTARDTLDDRVLGLDLGADDYMTKPFDLPEFEARVRALIRRGQFDAGKTLTHGGLRFDLEAHRLFYNDQPVELSVRELAVLELLLSRQGQVVTKEQMVDRLFGWGDDGGSNAIEVYVHRVRKKLEPFHINIRTVRGMGYLLEKAGDA